MYAEMEPGFDETLILPRAVYTPSSGLQAVPSRPRLTAAPVANSPFQPRVTIADLRLPAALVHSQASALADQARAAGARHSMRLWRDACQQSIVSLARASTGTPATAVCEALYWELSGEDYHISITFAREATAIQ